MTDYVSAFKEGAMAAEKAEIARKSITEVFDDLDKQIQGGSEGKLAIERSEFERSGQDPWFEKIALFSKAKEKYWVIAAYNPTVHPSPLKKLAEWNEDRAGYPCTIEWADKQQVCEDRKALEESLLELLKDPEVGEILSSLSRLEPSSPEEDSASSEDGSVED